MPQDTSSKSAVALAMEIGSKARAGMHVARKSVHGFVVRAVAEAKSSSTTTPSARSKKRAKVKEKKQAWAVGQVQAVQRQAECQLQRAQAECDIAARELQREQEKLMRLRKSIDALRWSQKFSHTGYPLSETVLVLLSCADAVPMRLIEECHAFVSAIAEHKFQRMGGQGTCLFDQGRLQYQVPIMTKSGPLMDVYMLLRQVLFVCGHSLVRGFFVIRGGSHQWMHRDHGHSQSLSVFVCIRERRIRIGRRGLEDMTITMQAGDVLMFNNLVWHSGLQNDAGSCVLFFYFDMTTYCVTEEKLRLTQCDPSAFGFEVMLDEAEWEEHSAAYAAEPEDVVVQNCTLMEAPTILMQAFVPKSSWSLLC